jgi:hypothetical protein
MVWIFCVGINIISFILCGFFIIENIIINNLLDTTQKHFSAFFFFVFLNRLCVEDASLQRHLRWVPRLSSLNFKSSWREPYWTYTS